MGAYQPTKQEKARNMRYKKAALDVLNLHSIMNELEDISAACDEVRYAFETDNIIDALDGDEEEEYEFRMMFSELSAECENLYDTLYDTYVTEHFDDFFVGVMLHNESPYELIGYDSFQEDYYRLTRYEDELAETESHRRLKRLSKDELLRVAGQCFGIAVTWLNIQRKYDYLKAAFDIIKDNNMSYLAVIKDIDAAYEQADAEGWYEFNDNVRKFDKLCAALPDIAWLN